MNQKYEAVIGLEVHAQLLTDTKIFCGCSTKFGNKPNSNVCPVCLGHPGVLPVLNKKVVEFSILMGLATHCTINKHSIFARKNYFYPDLPKGYQISQYEEPICENGFVEVHTKNRETKRIGITRIHMEEDAGKSIHDQNSSTLIDVNRCGVPLIEIVSEPDIRTGEEAYLYLTKIKQLVLYLGICDGNMEEGSLRCDANISVRLKGDDQFGIKTEIKNMNSFRNVERAIEYEINRQIEMIEDGEEVVQQTLLWNADANEAYPMRNKEEAHDYRYFPDPDLLAIEISDQWLNKLKDNLIELPDAKLSRFMNSYGLPLYDSEIITNSLELADYYEKIVSVTDEYKLASNWLIGDVLSILNNSKLNIKEFAVSPENLGKLINLIKDGIISSKIAKEVFAEMLNNNLDPVSIVKEKNLVQISDPEELKNIVQRIIEKKPEQISEYRAGKEKVFGFFVGQVMKETSGKANPKLVNDILKQILSN